MNHFVDNFVGWMALALLVTVATVVWGIAGLLVWISGNGTMTGAVWRSER